MTARRPGRIDFPCAGAQAGKCKWCGRSILFIWTGKAWLPLDPETSLVWDGVERLEAHFAHCPRYPQRPPKPKADPPRPKEKQRPLFEH